MRNIQEKQLSPNFQKILTLLIWLAIATAYFLYLRTNDMSFVDSLSMLGDVLLSPIGPLVFIAIYAVRPLLFFPASLITIAAGALYGPLGILWTVIGSNLSALLAYGIGRFFGKGILNEEDSTGLLQRYAQRMRNNSFETVLIMRFIYLPYDLVNYLAGFLRINWLQFLLATALGSIPGTAFFVLIGASFQDLENALAGELPMFNPTLFGVSLAIFAISLLLSRMMRRRERSRTRQAVTF